MRKMLPAVAALMLATLPAWAQQQQQQQGGPPIYNLEPPPPGAGPAGDPPRSAANRDAATPARPALIVGYLEQADQALQRNSWSRAGELVERAETALLNRHTRPGAGSVEMGMEEGRALQAAAAARAAIRERDRAAAAEALRNARSLTAQIGQASASGAGAAPTPGSGFGSGPGMGTGQGSRGTR
ncbi:hypothetical protein [Falsiroseomonas sp.]|uniref:hypothetical protein n=1 Tax=Falsiroseomonas sp. TaxID=2870721 RepID=UPI003562F071